MRQRIYAALPLPLGATSAGEWLEIALTERFEPEAIRSRLQVRGRQWGAGGRFPVFHLPYALQPDASACSVTFTRRPSCPAACSCCLPRRLW